MPTIQTKALQTPIDIAIEGAGSVDGFLPLVLQLGISPTDDFVVGTLISNVAVIDATTVKSFIGIYPASGITNADALLPEGIGYWAIGLDFVVS